MILIEMQRNINNFINYITLLYKKYNKNMLFFNFSLLEKHLFIFYISQKSLVTA